MRLNLRKINQLIREAWAKGQAAAVSGRGGKSACYAWSLQVARDYLPDIKPDHAAQVAQGKARLHWDAERREIVVAPTTPAETAEAVEPAQTTTSPLPLIRLRIERPDGRSSESEIAGETVTIEMLDAAEDLRHTLTTGERPVIKNLYDLVAQAFSTTREDAKERLTAATYGMSSQRIEQQQRASPADRRRLAAGARALTLPDPQGDFEARAQLEIIQAGMCALQSLDDLGEEGNRRASENLRELEGRYDALKASLQP
jgi:hypothetical protein